jgi:PHP family Zn ribbon phosphoesterase
VANGGTVDKENDFAMAVAGLLKMPSTGGSDAHSTHGLGKFLTEFDDEVNTEAEFLKALHSKKYHPVTGLRQGNLKPYVMK